MSRDAKTITRHAERLTRHTEAVTKGTEAVTKGAEAVPIDAEAADKARARLSTTSASLLKLALINIKREGKGVILLPI